MLDATGGTAPSDAELAARIAGASAGEAGAEEEELCRRFGRRLHLYGLRHLRQEHAAADLAQRALLVMLEKLRAGEVRDPSRIGAFAFGVAHMLVRDARRGGRPTEPLSDDGRELPPESPVEPDPFASARLARCLAALAERARSIVLLTYYGERAGRQIAETLGMTETHVRVLRHRALAQLRTCMEAEVVA